MRRDGVVTQRKIGREGHGSALIRLIKVAQASVEADSGSAEAGALSTINKFEAESALKSQAMDKVDEDEDAEARQRVRRQSALVENAVIRLQSAISHDRSRWPHRRFIRFVRTIRARLTSRNGHAANASGGAAQRMNRIGSIDRMFGEMFSASSRRGSFFGGSFARRGSATSVTSASRRGSFGKKRARTRSAAKRAGHSINAGVR